MVVNSKNHISYYEDISRLTEVIEVVGALFSSAFGPKGLDKLIYDKFNDFMIITNDGATIIKQIDDLIEHYFGEYILHWGKALQKHTSDGIKTFYILIAGILKISSQLEKQGVARSTIIDALFFMKKKWKEFVQLDFVKDQNVDLSLIAKNVIKSSMFGKFSETNIEHLSTLSIKAIQRLKPLIHEPWFDILKEIQIELIPGTRIKDTQLMDGLIIAKVPDNYHSVNILDKKNPRIMLIEKKLYTDMPDEGTMGPSGPQFEVAFNNVEDVKNLHTVSTKTAHGIFEKIYKFKPDIIITKQGISKPLESLFTTHNILFVRRAKPKQFTALAKYLGIEVVDDFDSISDKHIVQIDKVIYKKFGRDKQILIQKTQPNKIGTIAIGGSSWYVCQEVERFLKKNLQIGVDIYKTKKFFYGGGNTEIRFVQFLKHHHIHSDKNIQYSIDHLQEAFLEIPKLLLHSANINKEEGVSQIISQISQGNLDYGVNLHSLKIGPLHDAGIYENWSNKSFLIDYVFDIALQVQKIDRIIRITRKVQ